MEISVGGSEIDIGNDIYNALEMIENYEGPAINVNYDGCEILDDKSRVFPVFIEERDWNKIASKVRGIVHYESGERDIHFRLRASIVDEDDYGNVTAFELYWD